MWWKLLRNSEQVLLIVFVYVGGKNSVWSSKQFAENHHRRTVSSTCSTCVPFFLSMSDEKTEETKQAPVDNEKTVALKEKIKAAFSLFDKEDKGCVVQEEVSTIMRYLGVFPSERKVVESILPDMQGDEPALYVTYEKFEKKMVEVMENHEDEPDMDDTLLKAFRTIDKDRLGYVEADQMKDLLETHGTPFRAKEVDSFLSRAKDMETGRIYYEDYIAMMTQELEAMDL